MQNKKTVAVLSGGRSSERKISLLSGQEVIKALQQTKRFEVTSYDPAKDLIKLIQDKEKIDVVFPALHGPNGEDGTIQGFLELLQLPYVGSGVLASALAIDKQKSYEIFESHGLNVPEYRVISPDESLDEAMISLPAVVKPNAAGSSIGVTIVRRLDEIKQAIDLARQSSEKVLIDSWISGRELTVAVLDNQPLPVVEIIPPGEFFDYQSKYDGSTQEIVPARIEASLNQAIQDVALKAHQLVGCRDFSRTDCLVDQSGKIFVLEINTIPGLTSESLLPKAARAAGIDFPELIDRLVQLAVKRKPS